jgi:hypothetical protein
MKKARRFIKYKTIIPKLYSQILFVGEGVSIIDPAVDSPNTNENRFSAVRVSLDISPIARAYYLTNKRVIEELESMAGLGMLTDLSVSRGHRLKATVTCTVLVPRIFAVSESM